ncbi:MAG TPA: hypothetical protein H9903_18620 [Candidatus Aquabacterium excrementipullorum]|nr:hypothetical protein [Candidatus Aquabacterium excrementipullorum]
MDTAEQTPIPPVIHLLEGLETAAGVVPLEGGDTLPVLRLLLTVLRREQQGDEQSVAWPDLWLELPTAMAFADAIRSAVLREFPKEAALMGMGGQA